MWVSISQSWNQDLSQNRSQTFNGLSHPDAPKTDSLELYYIILKMFDYIVWKAQKAKYFIKKSFSSSQNVTELIVEQWSHACYYILGTK